MNIGDYVKTKSGYICKIININDFREPSMKYGVEVSSISDVVFIGDEDIIKSSPNIIDLIEVGDLMCLNIANKKEAFKDLVVPRIAETENELQRYLDKLNNGEFALKGILTHEQIENGVYWL